MESVCGFRPGHDYACHVRLGSYHRASGRAPAIHRSTWFDLLYCPGLAAGHMYIPELLYLYLYGEVVWAGFWLELPLYPDRVVVGQPPCTMMVQAPAPRHRTKVAICALANFWLGARGRIPRLIGH